MPLIVAVRPGERLRLNGVEVSIPRSPGKSRHLVIHTECKVERIDATGKVAHAPTPRKERTE